MTESQAPVYEFGEYHLDMAKRLLFQSDGSPVNLTPKAFDTLLYMVENRGVVLKKEELMRAVWPDTVVEENNLNQSISTLRRALGDKRGTHRYIATVAGRGYRFIAEVQTRAARTETPVAAAGSMAVLPFMPLVAEHSNPALELGMADTLIARLSSVRKVIVRPISAVRKYIELGLDPLAAGRELGVETVLEGSIQRWGNSIRITVRLINVASGSALWAGTFDENFSNIFAVQDAIAERVTTALALQLGEDERRRLIRHPTENTEVYELYLKGRFHLFRLTPPEMQTGISYFEQAIAFDPGYAPAYRGLASALFRMPLAAELRPVEFYPRAREAAQKALDIDPTQAEARAFLGWISFWYEWDWSRAERHFLKAIEIDPNEAEAYLGYAHLLSNTGRHEEALLAVKHARVLNPLHLLSNALECLFLLNAGRQDEALGNLHKTLALDERFWLTHLFYSSVYFEQERFAEAAEAADQARTLSGSSSHAMAAVACALARLGRRGEARALLDEMLQMSERRYLPPYHLALLYNGLDEPAKAYECLERGLSERDPKMTFLQVEPKWGQRRSDPRFKDILRRVGPSRA